MVAAASAATAIALVPALPASASVRQDQWFLDEIKAPQAQKVADGSGVVVAVIDSGVDAGHPDLAGAVLEGKTFGSSSSQAGHTDPEGHGTRMTGIIAARGGGADHALGIAPKVKILPIAINTEGSVSLAEPIRWAVDNGADIINLSVGRDASEGTSSAETEALAYAMSKNVVVIAAAGNVEQGKEEVQSPANVPGVVAVSGVTRSGDAWSGSAHGPELALAAPAEDIVTIGDRTKYESGYSTGGATSDSAAIVTGVAALVRSKYPKMSAANVINRLLKTATDEGDKGRDGLYGYGVVNALKAVSADVASVDANPLGVADTSASESVAAPGDSTTGGFLGTPEARGVLVIGVGVIIVVVLILVIRAASRRRPAGPPGYGWPPGQQPPGYPQGSYPPVQQPPPGYPPPGYPVGPPGAVPAQYPQQQYPISGQQPPPGYPQPAPGQQQWPPGGPGQQPPQNR
ncbi:S8 family serine peptidase [Actinoplanes sp. NPDC051851]|uniref:S8 family serine peptidase n=1 Tax=Actinoplanes sp. NPDC051851 TaxID=3154753 RepID=UPI003449B425